MYGDNGGRRKEDDIEMVDKQIRNGLACTKGYDENKGKEKRGNGEQHI